MSEKIYVWDKFVRLFHWSLVVLFIFCYLTGEEESYLHTYSGYALLALVCLRIFWGFVGSPYARFSNFIRSPTTIFQYAKKMFDGQPSHYTGHNPLGGLMVIALLATLLLTSLSGLKLLAVEEGEGPFAATITVQPIASARADDDDDHDDEYRERYRSYQEREHDDEDENEEFWEEIHEASVNLMILLIILHIAGVALSSKLHNESLVKAMLTGFKRKQTS
ncbi:MAG: cytochrome b/b6 domain-containing protein [Motiliproteus sp.]|nr:cytochrome b/b6 domain-containing protein [Motiliproteus sp.]MCW9052505.1 cytochrome b/b6 domain-containing protein [Motiliproteus sp.]